MKKEIFEDEINFKREINELIEIDIRSCNTVNLYDVLCGDKNLLCEEVKKEIEIQEIKIEEENKQKEEEKNAKGTSKRNKDQNLFSKNIF